ncbi:hypothetical protein PHLGIDRAFT_18148 [Phlebiopsis gigantea 11061_1 CR5-6]|uniref:J domain-containing protein n=1 Tax=Phlebiopsis gigantea (strain 11061_1 CR5-6) TaxID=745531 RepID=A0A0C3P012_PHLG1|nr:hypothetical protein PHLGIDRAFT_18148 [Phlebiopsis gigantea 11061_1 CR5-6]
MFSSLSSSLINSASSYFYLPIEDDASEDEEESPLESASRRYALDWAEEEDVRPSPTDPQSISPSTSSSSSSLASDAAESSRAQSGSGGKCAVIGEILAQNDLYDILGVPRKSSPDRITLRRAYLARSRACHPDKFPGNADATHAFQKVNVAYDILSTPASKRVYDAKAAKAPFDFFSARAYSRAEDTFRDVVLGVFTDFLEGDLETVRVLLRAMNDLNPSLSLSDEGVDTILRSLHSIRDRALTCRACVFALHTEVSRLIEVQHAFRQLSYFDLKKRFRLTVELTRITISLPITLEEAVLRQKEQTARNEDADPTAAILNARVRTILHGSAVVLARLERFLK